MTAVTSVRRLLETGLEPFHRQVHAKELAWLQERVRRVGEDGRADKGGSGRESAERLVALLQLAIEALLQERAALGQKFAGFRRSYGHAVTEEERRELVLGLALALGASRRELQGDRRAFQRWFGYDAVSERYHRRISRFDRRLVFALGRLAALAAFALSEMPGGPEAVQLWRRMELEALVRPLFTFVGNTAVRIAAFRCLSAALTALPAGVRERALSDQALRYVYRTALERTQETWLQCEALTLLEAMSPDSLDRALALRIEGAEAGDDLFVRRHAVRQLGRRLAENPRLCRLLDSAAMDPNPAVRQTVAEVLPVAPAERVAAVLPVLLAADNEPAVRAAAVLGIARLCLRPELFELAHTQLRRHLEQEQDRFVLRAALEALVGGHAALQGVPASADAWLQALAPALLGLHTGAEHLAVRRWAAQARERLWGQADPAARALLARIAPVLHGVAQGRAHSLRQLRLHREEPALLGRVLALLVQRDFGFDLERRRFGMRVSRGNRFGFRLWRFVHEMRHPGTDKRQAFPHTIGRVYRGTLRANSPITAELAQTKVPGEPLFVASEEGWRPYLPLVDEMISVLDQPRRAGALQLYTSEGVTEVRPPRSLWRRLRARVLLTLRFSHYAQLRNWQEDSAQSSGRYVTALQDLGFSLALRAHAAHPAVPASVDPAVTRFFPAAVALPGLQTMQDLRDYFFSVYENSLPELALFITLMLALFFGRHVWASRRIRQVRRAIPFSIGGWGTRGKSGTERLKAALFNALGHTVVSKTTGCEAMFLYGPANGALREMFLFRPYDKATIWEQANVIDIAEKLDVDVFLWECMGLTPAYVAILQQQWMRDDLATITNTYPDHEDLQGPAGINIPQVMTNFIPRDATLITSEEQMLPILVDGAAEKNTQLHRVGWLEAGLITSDLLERFPYAEHPFNIALVTRLAAELGVDADFAVKEMADRVVADLGVLKASPVARVRGRALEFINGMSANERFGCLGNWQRMGFQGQDPYEEPGVWLSTVVNNRADRVPRSKVFASILVHDVSADHHFVIGTNLDGLLNYVREAWEEYAAGISLADGTRGRPPLAVLEESARRFRVAYRAEHVQRHVEAMLAGLGLDGEAAATAALWDRPERLREALAGRLDETVTGELLAHVEGYARSVGEYAELAERISAGRPGGELDDAFRRLLWRWFERKLVVIEDPHTSGNQIIDRIVRLSPPGLFSRVMGLQNIKGTGLDFVYRWQAWEACHRACEDLASADSETAERGLQALAGFQEYNALCEEKVRASIEQARQSPLAQKEWFQSELTVILGNLDNAMEQLAAHLKVAGGGGRAGLLPRLLAHVEAFLDAGDAVKRRKRANLIYRELAAARISHERAALELQALNKRQKGGWLQYKLESLLRKTG